MKLNLKCLLAALTFFPEQHWQQNIFTGILWLIRCLHQAASFVDTWDQFRLLQDTLFCI